VQEHTGSVDDRGIGRVGFGAERVEDLCFEGPGCLVDCGCRYLAGIEAAAKLVDSRAARLHNRGVAVVGDGGLQGREIEQSMDRRKTLVVGHLAEYSIAPADDALKPPASGRNGWS
jgi:hypothetical protein